MSSHGAESQELYCLSFPSKFKSIISYLAQPCLLTSKAAVKPCALAHRNQEKCSSPIYFKIIIITKSNCEWQSCLLPESSLNSPFRSGGNTVVALNGCAGSKSDPTLFCCVTYTEQAQSFHEPFHENRGHTKS